MKSILKLELIFKLIFISMCYISVVNANCNGVKEEIHDFVIVGGGTAGCILARRLSEMSRYNILVLEAGGEPPFISEIPILAGLMKNTEVDWNYTSIPQSNALFNYPNQVMNLTRGKMLGGTGSLNNLNFFRGNKLDFENWKNNGLKEWEWKKVIKYFKQIENDTEIIVNSTHHGYKGLLCISNPGENNPFINSFLNVLKKSGYTYKDPNGNGEQTGYSYAAINVCENKRQSTYTNYLKPVISRSNLKVETFAFVEKILFDQFKRATGVVYSKNGCRRTIIVNKEVIVSGGAINSPQLLMLSGIGPKHHLDSLNISVLSDLPVGENFQDHLKIDLFFKKPYEDIYNNETVREFFEGRGPLTNFSYGSAFINTRFSNDYFYPDIQLSLRSFSVPVNLSQNLSFILRAIISRPKSIGFIRLNSSNPYDYPIIDPRYLDDENDVKILSDATRNAVTIMRSMNVSKYGYTRVDPLVPTCDRFNKKTDKYWHCLVRNNANTLYHFCGTCRMGSRDHKSSVVDSNLRVIGVDRLRVVDASVMPSITTGNIQAAVMMIAEKAADLIKAHYLV